MIHVDFLCLYLLNFINLLGTCLFLAHVISSCIIYHNLSLDQGLDFYLIYRIMSSDFISLITFVIASTFSVSF